MDGWQSAQYFSRSIIFTVNIPPATANQLDNAAKLFFILSQKGLLWGPKATGSRGTVAEDNFLLATGNTTMALGKHDLVCHLGMLHLPVRARIIVLITQISHHGYEY